MKISDHISYREAVRSSTATRHGLDNTPSDYELGNMQLIAEKVFEPLREWVGGPIRINSFYRSKDVNIAVGGSSRSQHCEGRAIDLDDTFGHKSNKEMFHWIKDNLSFDQLIWEFTDGDGPAWVHVSYVSEDQNRNRCLKAIKKNGKTIYEIWQ